MTRRDKRMPHKVHRELGVRVRGLATRQLADMRCIGRDVMEAAGRLLMIPDFFHWCLCGSKSVEFTNATTTPQRAALALGIDPALKPLDALKAWMEKRKTLKPQKPNEVRDAAFMENSFSGKKVDMGALPAPYWHRKDGGPYITPGIVVSKDPETGVPDIGHYRFHFAAFDDDDHDRPPGIGVDADEAGEAHAQPAFLLHLADRGLLHTLAPVDVAFEFSHSATFVDNLRYAAAAGARNVVVGTTGDAATPLESSRAMARSISGNAASKSFLRRANAPP